MIGITSYGAYIPRLRLNRMAIFQAMGWFAPAIMMVAQGERSMCNWDEDAVTMAVAAARDCLTGIDKQKLDALYVASTTLPFADRQNAGIVAAALNLKENLVTADHCASQKAGTTALITALEAVASVPGSGFSADSKAFNSDPMASISTLRTRFSILRPAGAVRASGPRPAYTNGCGCQSRRRPESHGPHRGT